MNQGEIVNLIQGSQEWADLRSNRLTASEAPAMMGKSKYQSRNDLLKQKATGFTPEVSEHQQRIFDKGHEAEAKAREIAEKEIGDELFPVVFDDAEGGFLASMDGLDMLGQIGWEHKLASESLFAQIAAGRLDEHYMIQLDQQFVLSGAKKILFTASDGTEENCKHLWVERDESRFAALLAGWEQFRQDLADYQPQHQSVEPQGEAPESLPALSINLTGAVTASNLPDFKARALAMIDGIKTELVTDKDFADAESTVKFLDKGEKQLEASKQAALEQTASISELFSTIDDLRENMRQKRLHLNKLVKAEKENRRADIHRKANESFDAFLAELDCPVEPSHSLNIAGAMKGKRTIATLQAAADDEVARAKVEARQMAQQINDNKALIDDRQGDYAFLFSDWRDLIQKDPEFIKLQIDNRINHHKQEEQKRLDAERERIRQEEEAKARAEAQRKADEEAEAQRHAEAAQKQDAERAQVAEAVSHGVIPTEDAVSVSEAIACHEKNLELQTARDIESPKTVTITVSEYRALLQAQAELDALKAHGVDNWTGYDEAMTEVYATA